MKNSSVVQVSNSQVPQTLQQTSATQPLEQVAKLLGKRLRNTLIISNTDQSSLQSSQEDNKENACVNVSKRQKTRRGQKETNGLNSSKPVLGSNNEELNKSVKPTLNEVANQISEIKFSNFKQENFDQVSSPEEIDMDDSESLTANDFEILNNDNFFDSINGAFKVIQKSEALHSVKNNLQKNQQISQNQKSSNNKFVNQCNSGNSIAAYMKQQQSFNQQQNQQQLTNSYQISQNLNTFNNNESSYYSTSQAEDLTAQNMCKQSAFSLAFEIDPVTGLPKFPDYDPKISYLDEYWNVYLQNQAILAQIDKIANERNDLMVKIYKIENFYDENMDRFQSERYSSGRKKHNRRCANDIERQYKCPYPKCEKFYGSEGSLNLHIKIKHNGGNKTDREKIAKSIVFAQANGINLPDTFDLNLPPGSVEKAATQVGVALDEESIKRLEQDLTTKNEITVKKLKEIEMMKTNMQYSKSGSLIINQGIPHQNIKSIGGPQDKPIIQASMNIHNDESVFKVPPPLNKKKFSSNSENMFTPKNVHPIGVKPLIQPKVAFGESTNQIQSLVNVPPLVSTDKLSPSNLSLQKENSFTGFDKPPSKSPVNQQNNINIQPLSQSSTNNSNAATSNKVSQPSPLKPLSQVLSNSSNPPTQSVMSTRQSKRF